MSPADLNKVTLIGRLTRDPEQRPNSSVANIRLAVTGRKKDGNSWIDVPNYFDVVVFGRQAEIVMQYLTKGRKICVDGRLTWREWEKDGQKRSSTEIVADDIHFLDKNESGAGAVQQHSQPTLDEVPF
jgi:single-strand DNA-binding protein